MATKPKIDWEAIEREYRAGQLSIREIAKRNEITDGAIRRKAKVGEWQRDLSDQVREAVRSKLVRADVRTSTASVKDIVAEAAARGVDIVLRHRKDISRLNALKEKIATKAETILDTVTTLEDLNDASQAVESLGRTVGRLIPLERQAFGMDKTATDDRPDAGYIIVPGKST